MSCGTSFQVYGLDIQLVSFAPRRFGKAVFQHWCSTSPAHCIRPYFLLYMIGHQSRSLGWHIQCEERKSHENKV